MNLLERKRFLNKILILYSILPIRHKEFEYKKKEFGENKAKALLKLAKDIHAFLMQHNDYFSSFDLINIYYDKGQQIVYSALAQAFGISGFNVEFKVLFNKKCNLAMYLVRFSFLSNGYNQYMPLSCLI